MEELLDEHIKAYEEQEKDQQSMVEEGEVITVENMEDVEATPFVPDGMEGFSDSICISEADSGFSEQIKKTIDDHLTESAALLALKYEIDNNKILIQDIKSSVVSLKVSTSRIEKDVKEVSFNVERQKSDKRQLDTHLVDLEFRFNEWVTRHEEDADNNNSQNQDADVHLQMNVKEVIEQIEAKIHQLDFKITTIDGQNEKISKIAGEIKRNEDVLRQIQQTLRMHQTELKKLDNLEKLTAKNGGSKIPVSNNVQGNGKSNSLIEKKLIEFIEKTETNEKSIATAWVGLIAALLIIPFAYIMGKFF